MANPKPLEDPLHEREVFVGEIAGVGFVQGNVVVTLATQRVEENVTGGAPNIRRIVVGRLVLAPNAAKQLLENLQQLSRQLQAVAAKSGEKQN